MLHIFLIAPFIGLLLAFSGPMAAAAESRLDLDPKVANFLPSQFRYMRDASQVMAVTQVQQLAGSRWLPYNGTVYPNNSVVWLKGELRVGLNAVNSWLLETGILNSNEIDLYVFDGQGRMLQQTLTGDIYGYSHRPYPWRRYVFPVQLQAQQDYVFFLRLKHQYVLRSFINLIQPQVLHQKDQGIVALKALMFGALAMLFIFNSFLFCMVKDRVYFTYSWVLLLAFFLQFSFDGRDFEWLWPNWPWMHLHIRYEFFCIYAVLVGAFSLDFLQVRALSKTCFYFILVAMALLFICIFLPWLGLNSLYAVLSNLGGMFLYLCLAITGLVAWYRGVEYAKYYVIAWTGTFLVTLWFLAAIVNQTVDSFHLLVLDFSVVAQAVFISLALAARMKKFEQQEQLAKLEQAAKSDFLAKMSHEIRTPINGIIGMSGLLAGRISDSKAKALNSMLDRSARELSSVVNSILDYSKIEAGKMSVAEYPVSIESFFSECIYSARKTKANCKDNVVLVFDNDLADKWLLPAAPVALLLRCLLNGLARQHAGDVVLTVSQCSPGLLIRIQGFADDTLLSEVVSVGDEQELEADIFSLLCSLLKLEPRLLADRTGIDLLVSATPASPEQNKKELSTELCNKKVLLLDKSDCFSQSFIRWANVWRISVVRVASSDSAISHLLHMKPDEIDLLLVDVGSATSAFVNAWQQNSMASHVRSLWLNLNEHNELSIADTGLSYFASKPAFVGQLRPIMSEVFGQKNAAEVKSVRSLDILVAEDNRVNQMVISGLLAKLNHRVTLVENGQQAVSRITQAMNDFDCVLMDCEMPVLGGIAATHEIRTWEGQAAKAGSNKVSKQGLPIIGLSAHVDSILQDQCFAAGMTAYLTKPISMRELVTVLPD